MPVYKDAERGSWYCQFYYEDWTGKRKKKYKRGFRTKKEAQDYESEFKRVANADMDMSVASFVEVYFNDKSGELKERSQRNKRYMIQSHVIPYLGEKKMNEITPADIISLRVPRPHRRLEGSSGSCRRFLWPRESAPTGLLSFPSACPFFC